MMCGIFCAVGKLTALDDRFISNMFILDQLRGWDSCGLTAVRDGFVDVFKRAMPAPLFLEEKKYSDAMTKQNFAYMGHNRWATVGDVDDANAHPFKHGHITMQHNGTLTAQYLLPDSGKFGNDSENIAYAISKDGIAETWENVCGAAALMWWDSKKNTFNILKNKERSLYIVHDKKDTKMYAASERHMMLSALERNNLSVGKVQAVENNVHYEYKVTDELGIEVVKTPMTPHKPTTYKSPYNKRDYTGYKKSGTKVDFRVKTIEVSGNITTYTVEDNEDLFADDYILKDYTGELKLEVDDFRTAKVSTFDYLDKMSIKDDSQYCLVDDTSHITLDDIEFDQLGSYVDEKEDEEDAVDCSWCSNPIDKDESRYKSSGGETFCEDCKDDVDVTGYVTLDSDQQAA